MQNKHSSFKCFLEEQEQNPDPEQKEPGVIGKITQGIKKVGSKIKELIMPVFKSKNLWLWQNIFLKKVGMLKPGVDIIVPNGKMEIPKQLFESIEDYNNLILFKEATSVDKEMDDLYTKLKHPDPDMPNLTPDEVFEKFKFNFKYKQNGYITGAYGIGKSATIRKIANHFDVPIVVVFLSQTDVGDIGSIPFGEYKYEKDPQKKGLVQKFMKLVYPMPAKWPTTNGPYENFGGTGGIIFLDELNGASGQVLVAAHQLIQDRQYKDYTVPSEWVVIGAGNRLADDPGLTPYKPGIPTRFMDQANMYVTYEDFEKYANSPDAVDKRTGLRTIDKSVLAFLRFMPKYLHNIPKDIEHGKDLPPMAVPRTWEMASLKMTILRDLEHVEMTKEKIYDTFRTTVGDSVAKEFAEFTDLVKKVPLENLEKIMSTPSEAALPPRAKDNPKKIDNQITSAISAALLEAFKRKPTPQKAANILLWCLRLGEGEHATFIARNLGVIPVSLKNPHTGEIEKGLLKELYYHDPEFFKATQEFINKYGGDFLIPDEKDIKNKKENFFIRKTFSDFLNEN